MSTGISAQPITTGPKYHWFGYYDKLQFDPTDRYVLGMEVDFEHRSPTRDDRIAVGMIDRQDNHRWIELGHSRAWCWQQGCMLQWRPGTTSEVLWNDRQGDAFVCHVLDVATRERRTLPMPVYTVSPDGRTGFCPHFGRVNDMRPGYGYAGVPDPCRAIAAPEDSGLWHVDLETGECALILSIADVVAIPWPQGEFGDAKHYFNHLLVSPDGTRVEFLHRWGTEGGHGRVTRMLTVAPDGSDCRVVDDCGKTSHFIWRDPAHILAWSNAVDDRGAFYLFDIRTGTAEAVGPEQMTQDGHVGYLPGNDWLVNDTYPDGERHRTLYLYHVATDRRIDLGRFLSPLEYDGEWRCDLHPRVSRDGRFLTIDSVHENHGRQIYLLDIGDVLQR